MVKEENLDQTFQQRLKELREEQTQKYVAEKIGITEVSLSRYENGQRKPNTDIIYRISKYYNVSADYLIGLKNHNYKHAKWIESNIPCERFVCSECGGACWYYDVNKTVSKSSYCPNCGAKMDTKNRENSTDKKLDTLKLIALSAIAYQENINIIRNAMRDNDDVRRLYMNLLTVQGTENTIKLNNLVDSKVDVNSIKSIDDVVSIFYPK